jgi:hypothetical protein
MQRFVASVLAAVFGTGLAGCYYGYDQDTATARAATEFRCPEDSIQVSEIANHTYRLSGCGQHATYTCVNDGRRSWSSDWTCIKEAAGRH